MVEVGVDRAAAVACARFRRVAVRLCHLWPLALGPFAVPGRDLRALYASDLPGPRAWREAVPGRAQAAHRPALARASCLGALRQRLRLLLLPQPRRQAGGGGCGALRRCLLAQDRLRLDLSA